MRHEELGYLKEIENVDWIQEIIMERFDNATDLMVPSSIVYGGAIRDCIAGKELVGDLDIAVTSDDFEGVSKMFSVNPKWIPFSKDKSDGTIKSSGDLAIKFAPMSGISSFITIGGKVVQLVTSKYQDRDPLQRVIRVARMVDIVCCGVIMLYDGRVFEVVPGAYQDCLDGVLRINKNSDTIFVDALKLRVEKFINRGWKNFIDVNKTIKYIEDRREKIRKKESKLAELRSKRNIASQVKELKRHDFLFGDPDEKWPSGGYMCEISRKHIDRFFFGNYNECLKVLKEFAMMEKLNMRVKQAPIGNIYFETSNSGQSYRIRERLQDYYNKQEKENRVEKSFKIRLSNDNNEQIISAKLSDTLVYKPTKLTFGTSTQYSTSSPYTSTSSASSW